MVAAVNGTRGDAGRFVGRGDELQLLEEAACALDSGPARCIALVGEAGIGKTRLLEELVTRVDRSSVMLLQGRASDFEQHVPFALLIDALDRHLAGVEADRLDEMADHRGDELAAVFPSLARHAEPRATTQLERFRCHHAVRAMLERLAADRPLVLLLDDVHWADEASVELLAHLLRRRVCGPILVVLAYRPRGAPALLTKTIERAVREAGVELLELGPLGRADAEQLLLADRVDPALHSLMFEESGGNAFYLEQLARAPAAHAPTGGTLRGDDDVVRAVVPAAVRASLSQELDRFSDAARALLQSAAVVGEPFEPDVAGVVAELDEEDALAALDELVFADIVRATEVPRRFVFRHPIVRRAVYRSAGEGWRLAAHERAAGALRARAEPAVKVAPHLERSARTGDEDAIEVLRQAGNHAMEHAPVTAARCYRSALRLVPAGDASREPRLSLLVAMAGGLASAGRLVECRTALSEALDLLPTESFERRVAVVRLLAQTEAFLGRDGEAQAALSSTLAVTPPNRVRERAMLTLELAVARLRAGERAEAVECGRAALAAARGVADRALLGASAALLALAEAGRGDIASAHEHVEEAAAITDALPNRDLADKLIMLFHLAAAETQLSKHDAALKHGERGLAIAQATGQTLLTVPLMLTVGWSQFWLGRLEAAAQSADAIVEVAQVLGVEQCLSWANAFSAWVSVHQGDLSAATAAAELAVESEQAAPRGLFGHLSQCILGEVRVAVGQPDRGRKDILARGGGPELPHVERGGRAHWYGVLADAELALERVDAAKEWAQRAADEANGVELPAQCAVVRRVQATTLIAEGRPDEAIVAAQEAVERFKALGLRVEAARAQTVLGRARASAGDVEGALEVLETAYREHEACGAGRWCDEAARELRRLAHRVPRGGRRGGAASGGVEALSGREREVADLVAEGRTNKATGAALFLSERTIENHVSHIFRKLQVSSRSEIARQLGRGPRHP